MQSDAEAVLLGTNLTLPSSDGAEKRAAEVHLLPCAIAHDGPARVSDYFRPREVAHGGDGQDTGSRRRWWRLRGALFAPSGVEVQLPDA